MCIDGAYRGRSWTIANTKTMVGRFPECQVLLKDEKGVSKSHAEISIDPHGGLRLRDLASRNGTKLNGQNIQTAILADGDQIQIGFGRFKIHIASTELATSSWAGAKESTRRVRSASSTSGSARWSGRILGVLCAASCAWPLSNLARDAIGMRQEANDLNNVDSNVALNSANGDEASLGLQTATGSSVVKDEGENEEKSESEKNNDTVNEDAQKSGSDNTVKTAVQAGSKEDSSKASPEASLKAAPRKESKAKLVKPGKAETKTSRPSRKVEKSKAPSTLTPKVPEEPKREIIVKEEAQGELVYSKVKSASGTPFRIRAQSAGVLTEWLFDAGASLKKGSKVGRGQGIASGTAALEQELQKLRSAEPPREPGSPKVVALEAKIRQAKAAAKKVESVISPVTGNLREVLVAPGASYKKGDSLAVVAAGNLIDIAVAKSAFSTVPRGRDISSLRLILKSGKKVSGSATTLNSRGSDLRMTVRLGENIQAKSVDAIEIRLKP